MTALKFGFGQGVWQAWMVLLRSFGFDEKWINLGFQCVSTTFFSVVINGAGSQSLNVSLNLQCRLRREKVFYLPDMWVSYVRRTWQSERDFSGVLSRLFFGLFCFCFVSIIII